MSTTMRHALFDQVHLAGFRAIGAVDHGSPLDLRDAGRDADDHARAAPGVRPLRAFDETGQHALRSVEVGDDAVAHRPNRGNRRRGAAQHRARVVAYGLRLVARGVDRHYRRLVEDDATASREHNRVGGSEVNRQVASRERQDVHQH
jgi:hypothetical protein